MKEKLNDLSEVIDSYNDLFKPFEEFEKVNSLLSKLKGRDFNMNISSVEFGDNNEGRPIHPARCIDLGWSSNGGFTLTYYNTDNWNYLRLPLRSYMKKEDLILALNKLPLFVEKIKNELKETIDESGGSKGAKTDGREVRGRLRCSQG